MTALTTLVVFSCGSEIQSGQSYYEQSKGVLSFKELKDKFGEPRHKIPRGSGISQYFYSFNNQLGGMVSGFTVIVNEDVILFKDATYRFDAISNALGTTLAEFPSGEHWKINFAEYINKTRIIAQPARFGAAERNSLLDQILIPAQRLAPSDLKGIIVGDSPIIKYLRDVYPDQFKVMPEQLTSSELVRRLKLVRNKEVKKKLNTESS